jgi:hypothetical protein
MEDIANMLGDGLLAFAKQLRHVLLRQPDCFLLQPDIDFDFSVRVPVDENFGVIHHCILLKIDLRHRDLAVHQHGQERKYGLWHSLFDILRDFHRPRLSLYHVRRLQTAVTPVSGLTFCYLMPRKAESLS